VHVVLRGQSRGTYFIRVIFISTIFLFLIFFRLLLGRRMEGGPLRLLNLLSHVMVHLKHLLGFEFLPEPSQVFKASDRFTQLVMLTVLVNLALIGILRWRVSVDHFMRTVLHLNDCLRDQRFIVDIFIFDVIHDAVEAVLTVGNSLLE